MPMESHIDHSKHLVIAKPAGVLTFEEITNYQRTVWSDASLAHYDELVDMTGVEDVLGDTVNNVQKLSEIASGMNGSIGPSKLAIVAVSDYHYGMGRMFKALREQQRGSVKQVEVFRSIEEALGWLGQE